MDEVDWSLAAETARKLEGIYGDDWRYLTVGAKALVISDSLLGKAQGDTSPLPHSVQDWARDLITMHVAFGVEK